MSNTIWGDRRPGETSIDVTDQLGEGPDSRVTLHYDIPDWVRLPAELGGQQVKVTGHNVIQCPCHTKGFEIHGSKVLFLNDPRDICVIECEVTGKFLWVKIPKDHPHRDVSGSCYLPPEETPEKGAESRDDLEEEEGSFYED